MHIGYLTTPGHNRSVFSLTNSRSIIDVKLIKPQKISLEYSYKHQIAVMHKNTNAAVFKRLTFIISLIFWTKNPSNLAIKDKVITNAKDILNLKSMDYS